MNKTTILVLVAIVLGACGTDQITAPFESPTCDAWPTVISDVTDATRAAAEAYWAVAPEEGVLEGEALDRYREWVEAYSRWTRVVATTCEVTRDTQQRPVA